MRTYQQSLINLLKNKNLKNSENEVLVLWQSLPVRERASLFIDTALLITLFRFIQEQYWVFNQEREEPAHFGNFVKKFFKSELSPILFLHATLESSVLEDTDEMRINLTLIQKLLLIEVSRLEKEDHAAFATECLKLMTEIFEFEQQLHNKYEDKNEAVSLSFDRTFDIIDHIFNFDYKAELHSGQTDPTDERIFQGSGVGAQSSYNTIISALNFLRLPQKARLIDLGSGFGRVGFVISLLRPDISFTGYEYVSARVEKANAAIQKLGIAKQLFYQQDLSSPEFKIPEAEVYYLFDPFTTETYKHVVSQLNEMASKRKIMIVTKGNAREQFMTGDDKKFWSAPQILNYGNFCLFRSRG